MASVNYEKQKTPQEIKAKMKHDATDERLKNDHQNEHIDKSKTHLNKSPDYVEMCQLYDDRIAELDATTNRNKRKDRVTMVSLEIPVPADLERAKYDDWFNDVEKCVKNRYGDDNVLFRADHYDEEHEYLDPAKNEKVMSRVHTRFCVVPVKDGGLNAKWATSRSNMIQMNNQIHEMTAENYNCEFMDGTKRKSKESVTALKNASNQAEIEAREAEITRREQSVADYGNDLHDWELRLARNQTEFEEYKQQEETKLKERETTLQAREKEVKYQEFTQNKTATEQQKIEQQQATRQRILDQQAKENAKDAENNVSESKRIKFDEDHNKKMIEKGEAVAIIEARERIAKQTAEYNEKQKSNPIKRDLPPGMDDILTRDKQKSNDRQFGE